MSVRSTPGPSPYPTLPTYNTPDASSSRRSIRTPSYVPPPSIPSTFRQPSIAPSAADTSTPTILGVGRRKRINADGQGSGTLTPTSKDDWANMEPDEVFRRLPVNEVRRVESKMRSDALNKQSELRLMVGTRYRDLLTSATQIESLHASSLRLSDSLREVTRSCSNPDVNITLDGDNSEDGNANSTEEDDLINMLPTAAHMKLLLDAPEALYSYLAHHNYLNAAFLWLITRVVKESLNTMPEEQNGLRMVAILQAYLPLLQKQWETLLPFRTQIVQRATASLRTREKLDSKSLSETILAIILLDNLPVSDALDLLLSQRTKALRDTLQHVEVNANSAKSPEKEKGNRKRSNSRIQAAAITRSIIQERSTISSIITDSVTLMLETVSSVKTVFEKNISLGQNESLIEEMMKLIQVGDITASTNSITTSVPNRPPITSSEIIQNLPSSQILLRYLPNNIIGFTPFITPSTSPTLSDILNTWQQGSINLLKGSIPDWLKDLKNVKDIWAVRNSLNSLLQKGEFEEAIGLALEDEWGKRVKEVWSEKLGLLVDNAEKEIREAGEKVRNGSEKIVSPESILFSDISFPTGPTASAAFSATSHNMAFTNFRSTLRKRSSYRTPVLDSVLNTLEETAQNIKEDMSDLPESLYDIYSEQINDTLDGLIKVLDTVLESMGSARGDGRIGIEAQIFIGRVALYLGNGTESGFLDDIAGYGKINRGELYNVEKSLLAVFEKSTTKWKERSVQEALVSLAPLFDPYRGSQEIKSSWQGDLPSSPSHPIMVSLQSLVKATTSLGIPPSLNSSLTVVEELVKGFVDSAKKLEGWKTQEISMEGRIQLLVDIGFLINISGEKVGEDRLIIRILKETSPSFTLGELQQIIDHSLRKSQLLLYPLLSHLPPPPPPASDKGHSHDTRRNAALLRFGAPTITTSTGTGTEFRSPVVAAKPGKRMGLLSIAA
ncbi:hypothetical protein L486_05356 [Kwoniella mangroviensis CBS 10435]|uniref:Conserved oligomeric Golgi complex subunit 1 n=1 Tax=Kwoniella mangroviensis CBS 10435 TaxID=1331196 RepID=A0A1B9ILN0_9TREE|nr:hypothetical protein L486_05356 [Kwoniella mangroviensis CBS 10435]